MLHCVVVVAVDEASSVGTIEGAAGASIMIVRVEVAVRPRRISMSDWSRAESIGSSTPEHGKC